MLAYMFVYIVVCIIIQVQPAAGRRQRHSQNKFHQHNIMVFVCLNWIIGIILVFSATQLPEVSIIVSITTCVCIKYPRKIYKFIVNCKSRAHR